MEIVFFSAWSFFFLKGGGEKRGGLDGGLGWDAILAFMANGPKLLSCIFNQKSDVKLLLICPFESVLAPCCRKTR